MPIAIKFQNVTKYYRKGPQILPSLRDWISLLSGNSKRPDTDKFASVKNISFVIRMGEVVGFIGPNGAGKTTILKLISKVTLPSKGDIYRCGSVAGLLELGAGFHPELTGRENIIFNGMILGLKKEEIQRKFDEIVNFSGIENFLDMPVKFYSDGMKARLGFSISAYVEPDILLVDDVLAVGDESFQKKCYEKMLKLCRDKRRIVIFVSHDLEAVKRLCSRAIYLDGGILKADGTPSLIINNYLKSL